MIELTILGAGILTLIVMLAIVLLASWYDIRLTKQQQEFQAHPRKRQFSQRPHIAITLVHNGDLAATSRSLENLMKISYRKYDITVLGVQKSQVKLLPHNKYIRFVKNEKSIGSGRGELTLKMSGGVTLSPSAITQAVRHLNSNPDADGVVCAVYPSFYPSQPHLFASYYLFIVALFYKALSLFNISNSDSIHPIIWRQQPTAPSVQKRIIYGSDIATTHPPIGHFLLLSKMQHNIKQGSRAPELYGLLISVTLLYSFYAAVVLRQSAYLTLALTGFALLLTIAIWWHDHLSWKQKALFTLLLPVSFAYFCLAPLLTCLEMFANMAKAIFPIGVGLFVRVKNVLRIVG